MNPYANRTTIKSPEQFFGRDTMVRELFNLLDGMQSCSVVGPRRIGKTSLFHYLSHPDVYSAHMPENTVFAYIDLQELTGLGPDDLFYTAVERLRPLVGDRVDINLERDGTASGFRRFLGRVTDAGLRVVICCDEFEMLSQNGLFDNNFFAFLRGMCSNYNLALVTASRSGLYELCHLGNLQTSQFWNIFVERRLGLMTEDEARTLVTVPFTEAGHTPDNADISDLLALSGYHPMFISMASYHLFEAMETEKQAIDWEVIRESFMQDAAPHLKYIWDQLDSTAKRGALDILNGETALANTGTFTLLQNATMVDGSRDSVVFSGRKWAIFLKELIAEDDEKVVPTMIGTTPAAPVATESGRPDVEQDSKRRFGRYEIIEQLGRGGMATVYRAYDPNFDREVAVKVLTGTEGEEAQLRFVREARMIAALEHPAIVPVYDFGKDANQRAYLVMRLMSHGSLGDRLAEGPVSVERTGQILARVAAALDEAHASGIVHRDLKPANVLFDRHGDAYLADFGIAHWGKTDSALTGGNLIGTPSYMSPEQITGQARTGPATDIYAMGIMLFEMLVGTCPYHSDSVSEILMQHILAAVPSINDHRSDLPPTIQTIIDTALQKSPAKRFKTAGDVASALAVILRSAS